MGLAAMLDKRPIRHPRTGSRVIDGEAVIIIPEENKVKILNSVGTLLWKLADGTHTISDLVAAVCAEYEVDEDRAQADVVAFIEELMQAKMLVYAEAI